jgi:hypothetical protein
MKKLGVLVPVLAVLVQCNYFKKNDETADGGAVTAGSGNTTVTVNSIVQQALSFVSGGPFEGEITMNTTNAGKPPQTIVYMVKGTKIRFNTPATTGPGDGGYVIFDGPAKKMTSVSDAQKTAFVMDMNQIGGSLEAPGPGMNKATIDKTSKTDTVAGYSCEIWKVKEDNGDAGELCIAKGIAFPMTTRAMGGWMGQLGESFPLRVVISDPSDKEKTRMEVTKIDKKSLDASQFEVPAGYKTTSFEDMMKALPGMAGTRPHH